MVNLATVCSPARSAVRRIPRAVRVAGMLVLGACGGDRPPHLGVETSGLAPCPDLPNCVSSDARDGRHAVDPFELAVPAAEAWPRIEEAVAGMRRTMVVARSDDYLHAECRSAMFRFVDDLELDLRADAGIVAVRSASRVGRSDLGVNRRRVERLRAVLRTRGIIR